MNTPDLSIKQVENPVNNWCDSGHKAPALFRRSGPNSDLEPIKFFQIVNKNINQIVCEPCLIVANHLAKLKKENKI